MSDAAKVLEIVCTKVAEVLGAERDEVDGDTLWEGDLGGESLDVLDLSFRLEREFGVRVRFQDLASLDLQVGEDGALTDDSLRHVQEKYPLVDVSRWRGRRFTKPLELLTIADIAALVRCAMQESPAKKAG